MIRFYTATILLMILPEGILAQNEEFKSDCEIIQQCDSMGECLPVQQSIKFTFIAVDVAYHGEGLYRVAYDKTETDAQLLPDGTYIWGDDQNNMVTLMWTGIESGLWIKRGLAEPVTTDVFFLTCEVPD